MLELGIVIVVGLIVGIGVYRDIYDDEMAMILSIVSMMGMTVILMIGLLFTVTPTSISHDIKNVEIINDGYVIEYNNTKQFFTKNELEVIISDKNVLIEEKYEYSKVENQFPNNILFSNSDTVKYILQIKQK